jgi:4-deoxy-L-threo-5-hexosulose-uronate ketol-isomerase
MTIDIRYAANPADVKTYDTARLRKDFLVENVFVKDELTLVYSHVDRFMIGGTVPVAGEVRLEADLKQIGADYFLERREIGIINIGGPGTVIADDERYELQSKECLYIGKGTKDVRFLSLNPEHPAKFYFNSSPAHKTYPTVKIGLEQAAPVHLGSPASSNERTINKFIHTGGVQSCQLVMGLTMLDPNNMWNTMPTHTHNRRAEVYLYLDLPDDAVVFHYMGDPQETRHLVLRNEQAVISPSWSIHSGVGTSNYSFIWGMAGENQLFDDMDAVAMKDLY